MMVENLNEILENFSCLNDLAIYFLVKKIIQIEKSQKKYCKKTILIGKNG